MGTYVNPDDGRMQTNMRGGIYVDKSLILTELNKLYDAERRFVCVSRPRRFGKTIVGNLISAYYSHGADSRSTFAKLRIAQTKDWDLRLNGSNVIHLDLNAFYNRYIGDGGVIAKMTRLVASEMATEFPDVDLSADLPLSEAVIRVHRKTGVKFIFIIDEYDVFVRQNAPEGEFAPYLRLLNDLFKSSDCGAAIALAYLTGIIPIVRDKVQSKLNNFDEYTMLSPMELSPYIGFTLPEVKELCESRGMDYGECLKWYDGYHLADDVSVCNSNSVYRAIRTGEYGNYWTTTGSYEAVSDYIGLNFDGTKDCVVEMLRGGNAPVNVASFLNSLDKIRNRDDVFTYLIHLGYLAYDRKTKTCHIPNGEMFEEWQVALNSLDDYKAVVETLSNSRRLMEATWDGDAATVARMLDVAHRGVTSPRTYNNEGSLQSAIGLAYIYAQSFYNVVKELPAGNGYADMAFLPMPEAAGKPAIIVELKMDKSADTALDQIRRRDYPAAIAQYAGEALLVGVSYSRKGKRHACVIEKMTIGDFS